MEISDVFAKIAAGIVIAASIIQITPIKVNPWDWLFKHIGKIANEDLMTELEKTNKNVENIRQSLDDTKAQIAADKAESWRTQILRFGDEVTFDACPHTPEMWDNIMAVITDYNNYCREHPDFPNMRTVETSKFIVSRYNKERLKAPKKHTV